MESLAAMALLAQIAMGDVRLLMKARGHEVEAVGCSGSCSGTSAVVVASPIVPPDPETGVACEFPAALPCELE